MVIQLPEFVMADAASSEELDAALDDWVDVYRDHPDVRGCEVDVIQYVRGAAHMCFDHLMQFYATDPDPERRKAESSVVFGGDQYSVRVRVHVPQKM